MSSPAQNVASELIAQGIGTSGTPAPTSSVWQICVGRLIEGPDELLAIIDTGGFNPNTKWQLDYVTVQVIVRGGKDEYAEGYAKALDIKNALLGIDPKEVVTGVWWSGITMLADIAFLKYDENSRPLFSINFRILQELTPSAGSHRASLDDPNG